MVDTRSQTVASRRLNARLPYLLLQPTCNETDGSRGEASSYLYPHWVGYHVSSCIVDCLGHFEITLDDDEL